MSSRARRRREKADQSWRPTRRTITLRAESHQTAHRYMIEYHENTVLIGEVQVGADYVIEFSCDGPTSARTYRIPVNAEILGVDPG